MANTLRNIEITARNLKQQFNVTIELGKYAPGDGWTRYSVSVNGWQDIRNGMTARECEVYLSGLYDMLRVQHDENRRASA